MDPECCSTLYDGCEYIPSLILKNLTFKNFINRKIQIKRRRSTRGTAEGKVKVKKSAKKQIINALKTDYVSW